jgi:hypothetical protein
MIISQSELIAARSSDDIAGGDRRAINFGDASFAGAAGDACGMNPELILSASERLCRRRRTFSVQPGMVPEGGHKQSNGHCLLPFHLDSQ